MRWKAVNKHLKRVVVAALALVAICLVAGAQKRYIRPFPGGLSSETLVLYDDSTFYWETCCMGTDAYVYDINGAIVATPSESSRLHHNLHCIDSLNGTYSIRGKELVLNSDKKIECTVMALADKSSHTKTIRFAYLDKMPDDIPEDYPEQLQLWCLAMGKRVRSNDPSEPGLIDPTFYPDPGVVAVTVTAEGDTCVRYGGGTSIEMPATDSVIRLILNPAASVDDLRTVNSIQGGDVLVAYNTNPAKRTFENETWEISGDTVYTLGLYGEPDVCTPGNRRALVLDSTSDGSLMPDFIYGNDANLPLPMNNFVSHGIGEYAQIIYLRQNDNYYREAEALGFRTIGSFEYAVIEDPLSGIKSSGCVFIDQVFRAYHYPVHIKYAKVGEWKYYKDGELVGKETFEYDGLFENLQYDKEIQDALSRHANNPQLP